MTDEEIIAALTAPNDGHAEGIKLIAAKRLEELSMKLALSSPVVEKALAACSLIVKREAEYDAANDHLQKLGPEFGFRVSAIDDDLRSSFVDVLDEVFALYGGCPADDPHVGGEASYFINECRGGLIPHEVSWQDRDFSLDSPEALRAWIDWQRNAPPPQGEEKP